MTGDPGHAGSTGAPVCQCLNSQSPKMFFFYNFLIFILIIKRSHVIVNFFSYIILASEECLMFLM